ncbi:MAG: lysophospholipase [Acidobacteriia bacterium]|nr:lysophospholipase [Terriglobia bacterium]
MASPAEITAEMPPQVHSAADAQRLGDPIADRHGRIMSADGTGLFYRYWPADDRATGYAVIVLHGIGYHSGPYKVIADALNPTGIDVYGLDARGHGLSFGPRGYVGNPAQVEADVAAMVQFVKRQQPSTRVFLLGDSMGCNYALDYAKDNDDQLAGLILLAPAFYVDTSQIFNLESVLLMPYFFFAHRRPVINLVGRRLEESSRDPEWIAARRADPLAYKKVSFGYLLEIQRLIAGWKRRIAPRVRLSILMIKGEKDQVVSQNDCEWFERLSASTDKRFEIYPDVPHTTLWDPETPNILGLVGSWILEH